MLCSLLVGQEEMRKNSCEVDISAQEERRKITQGPHPTNLPFHWQGANRKMTGDFWTPQGLAGVSTLSLLKPPLSSHIVLSTCIAKGRDWLRLSLISSVYRYVYNIYKHTPTADNSPLLLFLLLQPRKHISFRA